MTFQPHFLPFSHNTISAYHNSLHSAVKTVQLKCLNYIFNMLFLLCNVSNILDSEQRSTITLGMNGYNF